VKLKFGSPTARDILEEIAHLLSTEDDLRPAIEKLWKFYSGTKSSKTEGDDIRSVEGRQAGEAQDGELDERILNDLKLAQFYELSKNKENVIDSNLVKKMKEVFRLQRDKLPQLILISGS